MRLISDSAFESSIRAELAKLPLSPSHATDIHLDRVLTYAVLLRSRYGGDIDMVCASALLHDLGRSDTRLHGPESARLSAQRAREILSRVGFPAGKIAGVLLAISEHDQPDLRPATVEGRLLKDADFLAGIGAVGIVRSALWTGESGGGQTDLVHRLSQKMPSRMASLEFPESRELAMQEYVFVALFCAKMSAPVVLPSTAPTPYVALEGISGSGKSRQVALLAERLARAGVNALVVREPSPWFRRERDALDSRLVQSPAELALLFADRMVHVATEISEALAAGRPVIADRSFVSSMVYQAHEEDRSIEEIAYLHRFMPQPTSLIILTSSLASLWVVWTNGYG